MRRGFRNRWVRDQSPQSDGIVTVSTLAKTTNYGSVESLQLRDKTPARVAELIRYGWLPKPPTV